LKVTLSVPYSDTDRFFKLDKRNLLYNLVPKVPAGPGRTDADSKVREALQNPIGSEKIRDAVEKGKKVALLVDDWTRVTPADKIAPVVIEELTNNGVGAEDIRVIFACGTHPRLSSAQMIEKIGEDMVKRFHAQNHNPKKNLSYLGASEKGTPMFINRSFVEADFKIAIGGICAHPVAGYGGGAKIIVPGVAGQKTIDHNHALADNPNVVIGKVEGNPVREDMEDIARKAGLDFIVNVILSPKREIVSVVAGDLVKAHRCGIQYYEEVYGLMRAEEADIVVLGANPRDATIYHGTFALPAAVPLLREGGTIIWVAPCLTGAGTKLARKSFRDTLSIPPSQLMKMIKDGEIPASGSVFDWCTSKVVHRNEVVLVSDRIDRKEAEEFGFRYGESIQEALDTELGEHKDAKVTVIPVGGLAVPIYE